MKHAFGVFYLEKAHGVCFISSDHMLGTVQCIQEDRVSVIPCAWVVEPSLIPETGLDSLLREDVTVGRRLAFLTHFFCVFQVSHICIYS